MRKRITKRAVSALIFASLFALVPTLISFVGYHTNRFIVEHRDRADYFTYYEINTLQTIYSPDEELTLLSENEIVRELDFKWNDILRCDYDNDPLECTPGGDRRECFVNVGSKGDVAFKEDLDELLQQQLRDEDIGTVQEAKSIAPRERVASPWVWQGDKPSKPATCYIEANTCGYAGFDTEPKCQKINSNDFRIE